MKLCPDCAPGLLVAITVHFMNFGVTPKVATLAMAGAACIKKNETPAAIARSMFVFNY